MKGTQNENYNYKESFQTSGRKFLRRSQQILKINRKERKKF